MLRKLIMFAITSGLASKLYKSFREGRMTSKPYAQAQTKRPMRDVPPA